MKSGGDSSVLGAGLYRKDALAVFRGRVAMRSSQVMCFSWQGFLEETEHLFVTLHGYKTIEKAPEKLIPMRSSDVW